MDCILSRKIDLELDIADCLHELTREVDNYTQRHYCIRMHIYPVI